MHIGYDYVESQEHESGWGKGSPVKVGIHVVWDSIAFWRIMPHKHVREPGRSVWPEDMIVNHICSRCLYFYAKATGKLVPELNRGR